MVDSLREGFGGLPEYQMVSGFDRKFKIDPAAGVRISELAAIETPLETACPAILRFELPTSARNADPPSSRYTAITPFRIAFAFTCVCDSCLIQTTFL
jgi:hypothetical protein